MRTIKFRGKRPDGSWNYGRSIRFKRNGDVCIYGSKVAPKTVGQFTGLHDASGKEIYEGDIVAGLEYPDFITGCDGEVNAVVIWDADTVSFILDAGCRVNIRPCADIRRLIRVIGDIHTNPELLEGGGKWLQ